uniref:RHS repeat domain-containing protein n=1 Tax=Blastopirellula marina TaxID=124 RepID=UPI000E2F8D8A
MRFQTHLAAFAPIPAFLLRRREVSPPPFLPKDVGSQPFAPDCTPRASRLGVNAPNRLVCWIDLFANETAEQRIYPIYDATGNVVAIANDEGEVLERYQYDPRGNVAYLVILTRTFSKKPGRVPNTAGGIC